jgi:hypothetical protein
MQEVFKKWIVEMRVLIIRQQERCGEKMDEGEQED